MKSYNKCLGCGIEFQSIDINEPGYISKSDAKICQNCFRSKNYGEYSNNLSSFYDLKEIKEIKNDNVIMIIDILNPYETLISGINNYAKAKNLTILVNKVDVLPKSITKKAIINYINEISFNKGIEFSQLALVSANKKINIDSISSFIINSNRNTSIIGYSNVGKSSIIKALFESTGSSVENLIINSIGTTKKIIELEFKDKIVKDYPGIVLEGSYQNIMNIKQLKQTHPKKEVKVINYQLNNEQSLNINDYAIFNILEQKNKLGYQFTFSNLIEIHRSKYKNKIINKDFINHEIKHKPGERYDLIISGLGTITFKSMGQEITLELPKEVKYNLIKSLYK